MRAPASLPLRDLLLLGTKEAGAGRSRERSARYQAYRRLRQAIIVGQLPPGRTVSEQELADAFGVSRTPVREALQQLADEGLVVIRPQQGTEASRISPRRVLEAQFVREVLERAALAVTAQRGRSVEFASLGDSLAAQDRAARQDDFASFFEADQEFHSQLAALSGLEGIGRLAGTTRAHLDRVRALSLPEPRTMQRLTAEHRAVVRHLKRDEHEAADQVLRDHLRGVLAVLPRMQERFPDYFVADDGEPVELVTLSVHLPSAP